MHGKKGRPCRISRASVAMNKLMLDWRAVTKELQVISKKEEEMSAFYVGLIKNNVYLEVKLNSPWKTQKLVFQTAVELTGMF